MYLGFLVDVSATDAAVLHVIRCAGLVSSSWLTTFECKVTPDLHHKMTAGPLCQTTATSIAVYSLVQRLVHCDTQGVSSDNIRYVLWNLEFRVHSL